MQLPILTLTLNPALDMATEVAEIIPGQKLRRTDPMLDPGGGGLNVSRAIRALGGDSLALVALGLLAGLQPGRPADHGYPAAARLLRRRREG